MAYTGQLKTNEVFASLFNMIISIQMFDTGISNLNGIYSSRKVDGTLYGDTKVFRSTDVLKSYGWDGTDTPGSYNLLTVKRPPAPIERAISIDVFRQIPVTVDDYLTKRAFFDEGAFSSFNSVILSWLNKTKEIYEHTTYTAAIITKALTSGKDFGTIDLKAPADVAGYDLIRWRGQELARQIEDRMNELQEPTRAWNDNGFLRNHSVSDFDILIPLGVLSSVRKHDVPFLYNVDEKPKFKEVHWKYFGAVNGTAGTTVASNKKVRALYEGDYGSVHLFTGDLLPNSTAYDENVTYTCTYETRPSIGSVFNILLVDKRDFPVMSAFSVGTSFFNARRLDMNHYLTFGHNNVAEAHIGEFAMLKLTTSIT